MIVFLFGSQGMAGHMIANYLKRKTDLFVYTSSRYESDSNHYQLDVLDNEKVRKTLNQVKPDIIINCTGILNQYAENDPKLAFLVNGLFPHRLVEWADKNDAKVIQISTDCVFLGVSGNYSENDKPDGQSVYAKSKILGELTDTNHLTIRTSIIGPELKENGIGLFHWFMKQQGQILGYKNVLWNGVTTLELAKAIHSLIEQQTAGLYHLTAPTTISKYTLLKKIQTIFHKNDVTILPSETPVLNRTLINTRTDFSYEVSDYDKMLLQLKEWMGSGGE
ncbi:NAD(P)-dependent oxidoreductase [Pueribacillus theae]|uniref:dTDP-4-dehydrorhamnose reductase n=1 Tax=Pueribacillus theae TaxID=2171751 RepID=A0A2U1K753_9BACI|nr:SDR family oxidoreductase [Pueribacillus theae]PWA12718.1 NAD(P)-dependent oxidoreductase [Pueribacillus theae]